MRVFIALLIEEDLREKARRAQEQLKKQLSGASISWVASQNFHFTLVFLDEQSPDAVEKIGLALEAAAARLKGFEAKVGGWGAFPNLVRPKTLWIGVESSNDLLEEIYNVVELCLQPIGFKGEERGFHAHLTIGRVKGHVGDIAKAFETVDAHSLGIIKVSALSLMQSTLQPQGAEYTEIKRFEIKSE